MFGKQFNSFTQIVKLNADLHSVLDKSSFFVREALKQVGFEETENFGDHIFIFQKEYSNIKVVLKVRREVTRSTVVHYISFRESHNGLLYDVRNFVLGTNGIRNEHHILPLLSIRIRTEELLKDLDQAFQLLIT